MSVNDSYLISPFPQATFPFSEVGYSQIDGFNASAAIVYYETDVLNGPSRRKLDAPIKMLNWTVRFFLDPPKANRFEDFYVNEILNGLYWFNMPLAAGDGLQLCIVRERKDGEYTMTRNGPHFDITWALEGYPGTPL